MAKHLKHDHIKVVDPTSTVSAEAARLLSEIKTSIFLLAAK